jgi:hypothetical protein
MPARRPDTPISSHDIAVIGRRSAAPWGPPAGGVEFGRRHRVPLAGVRDDGPDEAIATARHRLDPLFAAGELAQHPAHGRDLHREVAVLDSLAGPGGFDQCVFRDQHAGPFDQCPQQGDRPPAERHRLAAAE